MARSIFYWHKENHINYGFQNCKHSEQWESVINIEFEMQGRIQDSSWEGLPTLQKGVPTYDFARISKKLREIENILNRRVGHAGGAPLDLPMK